MTAIQSRVPSTIRLLAKDSTRKQINAGNYLRMYLGAKTTKKNAQGLERTT